MKSFLVKSQYSSSKANLSFLEKQWKSLNITVPTHILKHLNDLSEKLQSKSKLRPELFLKVIGLYERIII
jgi:hypothetical protein